MKPLNEIARLAFAQSNGALHDYVMRILALLPTKNAGASEESASMDEMEEMEDDVKRESKAWARDTARKLDKDVQQEVNIVRDRGITEMASLPERLSYAVGNAFPTAAELGGVFNEEWSKDVWKQIEGEREALGLNISNNLWDSTKDAQNQINDIIKQSTEEHWAYSETKDKLAELLTEKGRANVGYNTRRLWVDQVKRNHIVAERQLWTDTGYIDTIILSRSETGYECDICGEEIGDGPGASIEVPMDYAFLPPYHPWCGCEASPKMPSKESMRAFLNGEVGSPEIKYLMAEKNPTAEETPTIVILPKEPVARVKLDVTYLSVKEANNVQRLEKRLEDAAKKYGYKSGDKWTEAKKTEYINTIENALWKFARVMPPPKLEEDATLVYAGDAYMEDKHTISIRSWFSADPGDEAELFLHEYGHYIVASTSGTEYDDTGSKGKVGKLGSFSTYYDLRKTQDNLIEVFDKIQSYTVGDPDAPGADKSTIAAEIDRIEGLMDTLSSQTDAESIISGLTDMTLGLALGYVGHDNAYLTRKEMETNIAGARVGIAVQEALNELWVGLTRYENAYAKISDAHRISGGVLNLRVEMEKVLPGLYDAVKKWADYMGGSDDGLD